MWHWLQSGLLKTLWRRLAVFSLMMHLFLLAALFLSGESSEHRSLDLSKVYDPHAKIVLLPFYKVVPAELNKHRGSGVGGGGKGGCGKGGNSKRVPYAVTGAGRPATTLVHMGPSAAEKRTAEKKRNDEKRRIAKARAEKKAQLLKKQQEKKQRIEARRAKIKEAARKKSELKKSLLAKKREQEQLKKDALERKRFEVEALEKAACEKTLQEKNEQKVIGQVIENPAAKNLSEQSVSEVISSYSTETESISGGNGSGEENIIYVGRDEIDQYRENTELRDALAAVWHPPFGLEPDEPCKLEVVVDSNGNASRVTVEASSGILVYDSAAQAALYETVFPEREYSKVLHITFR